MGSRGVLPCCIALFAGAIVACGGEEFAFEAGATASSGAGGSGPSTGTATAAGGSTSSAVASGGTTGEGGSGGDASGGQGVGGTGSGGGMGGAPSTYQVAGHVNRSSDIAMGNNGQGILYVFLLDACSASANKLFTTTNMQANLSTPNNVAGYLFNAVPDGTYYVTGFLDDNLDANPNIPVAGPGDIVFTNGNMLGCLTVVVAGMNDFGNDFTLNTTLP